MLYLLLVVRVVTLVCRNVDWRYLLPLLNSVSNSRYETQYPRTGPDAAFGERLGGRVGIAAPAFGRVEHC